MQINNIAENIIRDTVSHPKLARGQVWCTKCGATLRVDSSDCMRNGWPKCCGYTMTIDSPSERKEDSTPRIEPRDDISEDLDHRMCKCGHEYQWHFERDKLPSGRMGCGHPACECRVYQEMFKSFASVKIESISEITDHNET